MTIQHAKILGENKENLLKKENNIYLYFKMKIYLLNVV